MCFTIDTKAKSWTKRYVWKVVRAARKRSGDLKFTSPQSHSTVEYKIGKGRQIKSGAQTTNSTYGSVIPGGNTRAGIYVARTFADAVAYANDWRLRGHRYRIIKLAVDPKDFLFASAGGRHMGAGTYRKVKVLNVVHKAPSE